MAPATPTNHTPNLPPRRQPSHRPSLPPQRTLRDFFPLRTIPTNTAPPTNVLTTLITSQETPPDTTNTPPATPLTPLRTSEEQPGTALPNFLQTTLPQERSNRPWGDIWDAHHPSCHFRLLSKNTNTINPYNLDMVAITDELNNLGASIFAAQETNINWNPSTISLIAAQCCQASKQVLLSTASSVTQEKDWHQPGGTLLMTLNKWTSQVIDRGMDKPLGRWSFVELVGQQEKKVIIVSAYRVCNQKFDAASNTATAQQIRLMQTHGVMNSKPRTAFLNDLIHQIHMWRNSNKEVILCMDANEDVDNPRSAIRRIFNKTDLVDLHHHQYPSQSKPATHQRGSTTIDLIAGSPLPATALRHAWIHPFHEPAPIKGDHRLLGVDFDPDILFGSNVAPIDDLGQRGVNSRHPQTVTKFCKRVMTQCQRHQIAERLDLLKTLTSFQPKHHAELELIDSQLTRLLTKADRDCRPNHFAAWSPQLNQAYLQYRLWTIALSGKRNKQDVKDAIAAIHQRLTPSPEDDLEKDRSITANLRHAQKQLRKAKREADTLRRQHLEAVLNEAIVSNHRKKSKVLTHLIRAEKNKKCYAAFRSHTKPKSSGGLAAINTTTGPGDTPITLTDRTEIEDTLLDYSREHFAKAHGSPFTSEPLSRLLQYDGLMPFGYIIFKGNTDLHSLPLDEPTQTLLEHLNNKLLPDTPRNHPIDYKLLLNGIKKWPEKMTTSPSGRHLGIYKSLQRHVVEAPKTDKKSNPTPPPRLQQGRDILYLIFDIMTLALRHQHTLERWKMVWTIFIEKELGNPDIN